MLNRWEISDSACDGQFGPRYACRIRQIERFDFVRFRGKKKDVYAVSVRKSLNLEQSFGIETRVVVFTPYIVGKSADAVENERAHCIVGGLWL